MIVGQKKSLEVCETSKDKCQNIGVQVQEQYNTSANKLQEILHTRYTTHKENSLKLSSLYRLLSQDYTFTNTEFGFQYLADWYLMKSKSVADCSNYLAFGNGFDSNGELVYENKLLKASFCRDRLCSMCNWRKSLKLFGQVSQILDRVEKDGFRFLFLTLTVPNVAGYDLDDTITRIFSSFRKLERKLKDTVKGSFKALEVTYNKDTFMYHPHLHIILAVSPSYFNGTSGQYLSHDKWLSLWRKCYNDSTISQVNIQAVKSKSNGIAELTKYATKSSDFINLDELQALNVVDTFSQALNNRRLFSYTGIFKQAYRILNCSDIESSDLTDLDYKLRTDITWIVNHYNWSFGCYVLDKV